MNETTPTEIAEIISKLPPFNYGEEMSQLRSDTMTPELREAIRNKPALEQYLREQNTIKMSNLREETFLKVAEYLNTASEQLQHAAALLEESGFWAHTSEHNDINYFKNKILALARDFNPAFDPNK